MKFKEYLLKDIATITMGQSPKSQFYNEDGKGIEFLQGVRTFGEDFPYFDTYTTKYNRLAYKNSILFSVRAPVGRVNWATKNIAIGRGVASISVKNMVYDRYVYYYFKKMGSFYDKKATGTVFTSINKKELESLKIKVPASYDDQKRIADRLATLDRKIHLNQQLNANLFKLAKIHFDRQLDSENIKFSQISTIQNGYAFKSKEYVDTNELMILRTKNINDNHLFSKNDVVYISKELFDEYKKFSFSAFDTVLVMVGASIGKTGFVTSNMTPSLQNQNMWRFRPKMSNIPGLLIFQYVNYINKHVIGSATGSARSFYRKKLFSEFEVPRINSTNYIYFDTLQREIDHLNTENEILYRIKHSLLNHYF